MKLSFKLPSQLSNIPFSLVKYLLIFVGIIILLVFVNAQFDKKDKMDEYIEQVKTFRAQADSAIKFSDSLKTHIVNLKTDATEAEQKARSLNAKVGQLSRQISNRRGIADSLRKTITDSIELARVIIPHQDSIIAQQDTVIKTQHTQMSQLNIALAKKDTAIDLLTVSRDSLRTLLAQVPPPPKNPNKTWLGIRLPTRKQSAIAGAIVGSVITGVLIKR